MEPAGSQTPPREDRAFLQMLRPAVERLRRRAPEEVAERAGGRVDPDRRLLLLETLGETVALSLPRWAPDRPLESWHHLLLLHYLEMADGTACDPRPMAFGEIKNGVIRGVKFDRTAEGALSELLWGRTPEAVRTACLRAGGEPVPARADLSVQFRLFPRYPLLLNVYFADEEFPASGKLLVSRTAGHYLDIEDAVVAGELLLRRLRRAFEPSPDPR